VFVFSPYSFGFSLIEWYKDHILYDSSMSAENRADKFSASFQSVFLQRDDKAGPFLGIFYRRLVFSNVSILLT